MKKPTRNNNLHLGEASTNSRWGIGMTLEDPDVLDTTKWKAEGNLLGNLLMTVRGELQQRLPPRQPHNSVIQFSLTKSVLV